MKTTEFKTFTVEVKDAQAWVTFDNPPVTRCATYSYIEKENSI